MRQYTHSYTLTSACVAVSGSLRNVSAIKFAINMSPTLRAFPFPASPTAKESESTLGIGGVEAEAGVKAKAGVGAGKAGFPLTHLHKYLHTCVWSSLA